MNPLRNCLHPPYRRTASVRTAAGDVREAPAGVPARQHRIVEGRLPSGGDQKYGVHRRHRRHLRDHDGRSGRGCDYGQRLS